MKKSLFVLLLMVISMGAFAQKCYKLTGDNVYVRKGPGKNYAQVHWSGAYGSPENEPVMLSKGAYVYSRGAAKNGFIPVSEIGASMFWVEGWISAKYLAPAAKCRTCNGKGYFNQKCPECNGEGVHVCCDYTGKKRCPSCYGIGYK